MICIFTKNITIPKVFFKHLASKNQLPGLSVSGTLVEYGLKAVHSTTNAQANYLMLLANSIKKDDHKLTICTNSHESYLQIMNQDNYVDESTNMVQIMSKYNLNSKVF